MMDMFMKSSEKLIFVRHIIFQSAGARDQKTELHSSDTCSSRSYKSA